MCKREVPRARQWGKETHALTFLGRVPVKRQPGEVEHSNKPAIGTERVHEDDGAGHSWWASKRPQVRRCPPCVGLGLPWAKAH